MKKSDELKTRRNFLGSLALTLFAASHPPFTAFAESEALQDRLAQLEREAGGRIGVALLQSESGSVVGYRTDEPFPMCSTFKVLAVAAVLRRVDRGQERLERPVPIAQADILAYAPVTSKHVGPSGMTIAELCQAAITFSDNTAANLLLSSMGGPAAVTAFACSIGDQHTRLDRTEPTLNEAAPGDLRDTTTPRAMANDLRTLLLGAALSNASRAMLKQWMVECQTGLKKIRSALPQNYLVGDKTGSGDRNTSNDVAVIWPPAQSPQVLTVYLTGIKADQSDAQAALIAEVTRACFPMPGKG
jgi:beta-lactamase class A